jgi:hypothetical protein
VRCESFGISRTLACRYITRVSGLRTCFCKELVERSRVRQDAFDEPSLNCYPETYSALVLAVCGQALVN